MRLTLFITVCILFLNSVFSQISNSGFDISPDEYLILDKHMEVYDKLLCRKLYERLNKNTTVIVQTKAYLPAGVNGVTYDLGNSTYLIQLVHQPDQRDRWWTLLHEWSHVIQFSQGKLEEPNNGPIRWMGVPSDFNKPWSERPWELEADVMANKLWDTYLRHATKPEGRPRK
jgi:hypothetical protein